MCKSKIRIIKIPAGFAPEKIRAEWVGVEIPLVPDREASIVEAQMNVKSVSVDGYIVRGEDAVQVLIGAGKKEAAAFWSRPFPPPYLRFARECCEAF